MITLQPKNVTGSVGDVVNFTCAGNVSRPVLALAVHAILEPNVTHTTTHSGSDTSVSVMVEMLASTETNGTAFYCVFVVTSSASNSNKTSNRVTLTVLSDNGIGKSYIN